MKKTLTQMIGGFLIVLGIAGLFLPLLQGILFITMGISLVGNKKFSSFMQQMKQYFHTK